MSKTAHVQFIAQQGVIAHGAWRNSKLIPAGYVRYVLCYALGYARYVLFWYVPVPEIPAMRITGAHTGA